MAYSQTHPYNRSALITKSDTINYDGSTYSAAPAGNFKPIPADGIFVGGAGIVVAVYENGQTGAFTVAAGTLLPIKTIRVNSTTTSATLMEALYTV